MQTIFNEPTLQQLINRIEELPEGANAKWGKMNAHQMIKHGIRTERMYHGKDQYQRTFIGKLFGRMALKSILKDEAAMQRNQPTHPKFAIGGLPTGGTFAADKQEWIDLLERYAQTEEKDFADFVHPFFGRMNRTQIGQYVYKHTDHHLRQFSV